MSGPPAKILSLEALAERVAAERAQGRRIVHCHGVFDLLHIGHIRYLQRARQLGDCLVVTVTPDRFVNKGPHRPVFTEGLRADAIAALACVDWIALNQWPTAVEALNVLHPDIYAKGAEFRDAKTPELLREEAAIAALGGQMEFVAEYTSSSSHLINNYLSPLPEESQQYLAQFRSRHSAADVCHALEQTEQLQPLVIGEAIIDEYYQCESLGRSSKAPIIVTRYQSHARHLGGALAVANHLAALCRQVRLVALVGDDREEDWVRSRLRDNIDARLITKSAAPTVTRRRYRESYFDTPLFEVDFYDQRPLADAEIAAAQQALADRPDCNLLVSADSGHSLLCPPLLEQLAKAPEPLAVSAQLNGETLRSPTFSKYARADFLCLSRRALEMDSRSPADDVDQQLAAAGGQLGARRAIVTLGKTGCLAWQSPMELHRAAGLSTTVVDRTGGGDAFFAVAAAANAAGADLEVTAFLGNVAGAEAVAFVGGSQRLNRERIRRNVESLLK